MYYRGKYTYRKPQFVDMSQLMGSRRLITGWQVGIAASGIVVESPRGRQYLVEWAPTMSGTLPGCFALDHRDAEIINDQYQVRIIQKSNRPGVYRGVVNRRLTPTAQKKIISAVLEYVDANQ